MDVPLLSFIVSLGRQWYVESFELGTEALLQYMLIFTICMVIIEDFYYIIEAFNLFGRCI